jgi:hypothetical protein
MGPAPKRPQHRPRIVGIRRLAESAAVDDHDRVGAQHQRRAPRGGNRARFPERQPGDGIRQGDRVERLLDVAGDDFERDIERCEELAAPW